MCDVCLRQINDEHHALSLNYGSLEPIALHFNQEESGLEFTNIRCDASGGVGEDSSVKRYDRCQERHFVLRGFTTGTEHQSKRLHFLKDVMKTVRPRWR